MHSAHPLGLDFADKINLPAPGAEKHPHDPSNNNADT